VEVSLLNVNCFNKWNQLLRYLSMTTKGTIGFTTRNNLRFTSANTFACHPEARGIFA
jgi:hypothetical protein